MLLKVRILFTLWWRTGTCLPGWVHLVKTHHAIQVQSVYSSVRYTSISIKLKNHQPNFSPQSSSLWSLSHLSRMAILSSCSGQYQGSHAHLPPFSQAPHIIHRKLVGSLTSATCWLARQVSSLVSPAPTLLPFSLFSIWQPQQPFYNIHRLTLRVCTKAFKAKALLMPVKPSVIWPHHCAPCSLQPQRPSCCFLDVPNMLVPQALTHAALSDTVLH